MGHPPEVRDQHFPHGAQRKLISKMHSDIVNSGINWPGFLAETPAHSEMTEAPCQLEKLASHSAVGAAAAPHLPDPNHSSFLFMSGSSWRVSRIWGGGLLSMRPAPDWTLLSACGVPTE